MKQLIRILVLLFCGYTVVGQSYHITVNSDFQADSLHIKSYNNKEHQYQVFQSTPYQKQVIFKGTAPLVPGIYVLEADSTRILEFFISDVRVEKFTINIDQQNIRFKGSPENQANREFIQKMQNYDLKMQQLDQYFQTLKNGEQTLSRERLQLIADSLTQQAELIKKDKLAYQRKTATAYQGTLFSSVILATMEIPSPPVEYYQSKTTYYKYLLDHLFDHYPWRDDRLLNTPIPHNKFQFLAQILLQLEAKDAIPSLIEYLNQSKKSNEQYSSLFDYLETVFGSYQSLLKNEDLYIAMLENALANPAIDEARRERYRFELDIAQRNRKGSQAPEFNILLKNGDTTSLYKMESPYLLLLFQHPDCPACVDLRVRMESMDQLKLNIKSGLLKVITLFYEENEAAWRNYLSKSAHPDYLHGWNYDTKILSDNLYDLRITPMMILVDANKKVVAKDVLPAQLEQLMIDIAKKN
ncbi:MAG TPA: DUF5106 domain-containing protein [Bacteroidales bacterium]|nr:DUF5106 domain-containing protein [Bacteroidales bacterium]HPB58409.1 DUF5106 domain-containing protein [Bacteroidales bacterium]HPZ04047.1 DUF5106 domain-containing protein [Bacteroidales bacterium]